MSGTTQEVFEKYQVRKTKKQKTAFIEFVKQIAQSNEYDFKVETGIFGVRNVVIGNPDSAKILFTAHYDTCARLPFPNFITPKNFLIYLLYQFLIVGFFFAFAFLIIFFASLVPVFLPAFENLVYCFMPFLPQVVFLVCFYLLLAGPANKNTANDNTSGVATVLEIMRELPQDQRDRVAFVLFDFEEAGLFGSSSFASKHKFVKNNTLVLNFDCVSDGETILFVLKRNTQKYAELLRKAFIPTPDISVDVTRNAFYPSDNASFKRGVGVAALKKSKFFGTLYMDKIHTKKDVVYCENNIRFLTSGALELIQML